MAPAPVDIQVTQPSPTQFDVQVTKTGPGPMDVQISKNLPLPAGFQIRKVNVEVQVTHHCNHQVTTYTSQSVPLPVTVEKVTVLPPEAPAPAASEKVSNTHAGFMQKVSRTQAGLLEKVRKMLPSAKPAVEKASWSAPPPPTATLPVPLPVSSPPGGWEQLRYAASYGRQEVVANEESYEYQEVSKPWVPSASTGASGEAGWACCVCFLPMFLQASGSSRERRPKKVSFLEG